MNAYFLIVTLVLSVAFSGSRGAPPLSDGGVSLETRVQLYPLGDKRPYGYTVGEKIRSSLLKGCSIVIGSVGAVRPNQVELVVQQQLYNESSGSSLVTKVDDPARRSDFYGFSPWNRVEIEVGKRLLISVCEDSRTVRSPEIVVSEAELIESVKEVVEFDLLVTQNASHILQISRMLKDESDTVFAGYAVALLRGGVGNRNDEAIAISQILMEGDLIPLGLAQLRIKLRLLLLKDGDDELPEITRDAVFSNLVGGAGSKSENADEIFKLFFELAEHGSTDFARFVKETNRKGLLGGYRKFKEVNVTTYKGQFAFEKQLKLR